MTLVRLYGRDLGKSSLAIVTEGFRSVLQEAGLLAARYGLDTDGCDEYAEPVGATLRHGVYTGPMSHVGEMFRRGRHDHYWIMIAPNSNLLPPDLVAMLQVYQAHHPVHFLAPSRWAAGVVRAYLGECQSVPHGVSKQLIRRVPTSDPQVMHERRMRVLHFSTSAFGRKGTDELLKAWRLHQRNHPSDELYCVLDYHAELALRERLADQEELLPDRVMILNRIDQDLSGVYDQADLVCQPSRGEAFGLIPLEALSVGTPVLATDCTGHSEYMLPLPAGACRVRTGALEPLDDLPGSVAPSLCAEDLAEALGDARQNWLDLARAAVDQAPQVQEQWAWKRTLAGLVDQLRTT